MPIYEYEHLDEGCQHGKRFEFKQSIFSDKFTHCPYCGQEVKRLISLVSVNTPKGNSDLKNLGFTKLVKRDNGIYKTRPEVQNLRLTSFPLTLELQKSTCSKITQQPCLIWRINTIYS
jgi:putative FmdB family regulatory protein